ncbi:DNA-(apurinic or apyrimidinic site) lyase /endonuclease III [Anaerobacterium chartisolvens]|uniref:Endonuclease III n=1 Tax=Anaerobacterium chartisolvens TaxID=1297424 RepID=A0A369AUT5_9FIRM|nr:endonuclease III [Anaerobacterium chartisolvens]RCX12971.1 DNA-(apurinic or apyrimidinic site) lyase /endonuclease III [Anaerobacterium chartisolvens]
MNENERIDNIIKEFDLLYNDAQCSLEYKDPLQLLISTQLAAQCTDARVNMVTETLFQKYKNVFDFAGADIEELEQDIRSTGFYRNKARNIINCCRMLIEKYDGRVPGNMDDLLKLPGVGRKTANLVLGDIFGIPGIVVDTHAKRLANRIGLTQNSDPEKIEYDLMDIIPREYWSKFCHQLVYHGRAVCVARKPQCGICTIKSYCDYYKTLK